MCWRSDACNIYFAEWVDMTGEVVMRVPRATVRVGIVHVTLLFGGDPGCTVLGMSEYGPYK